MKPLKIEELIRTMMTAVEGSPARSEETGR
jgi:hypothetical protein